jgi:hypothetical protein
MVLFSEMAVLVLIVMILFTGLKANADIYRYVSDDGTVFFTNTPIDRNGKVLIQKGKPSKESNKEHNRLYAKKETFHHLAEEKSRQHDIDPQLVKAVIKAESNWNPDAVSPKGALGLMQLMPTTASIMGVSNPFNPEENIDGGIRYLKYLLNKFNGNLMLALAAYNAGPKLVERTRTVPSIPETMQYVRRVINYYSGDNNRFTVKTDFQLNNRNNRIQKIVLKDGTILFTNSYFANSYYKNYGF